MSDEPENLILMDLRRLDAKMDKVISDVRDLKHRVGGIELAAAAARREVAAWARGSPNSRSGWTGSTIG